MTVNVLSAVFLSKYDFTGISIAWDHCDTEKLQDRCQSDAFQKE